VAALTMLMRWLCATCQHRGGDCGNDQGIAVQELQ
jgi:hypothetical protein